MLKKLHSTDLNVHALLFAALGDKTRLAIITKLCNGEAYSISQLSQDSKLTRQAVTKHLRVLEDVGLVRNERLGRESLFHFKPQAIEKIRKYLELVSVQWDEALVRLKSFVEE